MVVERFCLFLSYAELELTLCENCLYLMNLGCFKKITEIFLMNWMVGLRLV
jgi:hypothetical protein